MNQRIRSLTITTEKPSVMLIHGEKQHRPNIDFRWFCIDPEKPELQFRWAVEVEFNEENKVHSIIWSDWETVVTVDENN